MTSADVTRALLALCLRGWEPRRTADGRVSFRAPPGDKDAPEAQAALGVLREHREEAVSLAAQVEPLGVAASILRAQRDGGDLEAATAPLATMSREDRLQVLRLLQAAMPERTARATARTLGGGRGA